VGELGGEPLLGADHRGDAVEQVVERLAERGELVGRRPEREPVGEVVLAPVRGPLRHDGDRLERLGGDAPRHHRGRRHDQDAEDDGGQEGVQLRALVGARLLAHDQDARVAAAGGERGGQQPVLVLAALHEPHAASGREAVGSLARGALDRPRDALAGRVVDHHPRLEVVLRQLEGVGRLLEQAHHGLRALLEHLPDVPLGGVLQDEVGAEHDHDHGERHDAHRRGDDRGPEGPRRETAQAGRRWGGLVHHLSV
jgi:hypothetical protein